MTIAPFTTEELEAATETLLAEGGQFAAAPMTIRGVDYPLVFLLSSMSLRDVLAMKAAEFADAELVVFGEERLTTAEVWARAMRFANWLHREGYGQGDRVAVAMRNYPEWVTAYLGAVAAGACVVPLNAWWSAEELARGAERSSSRVAVVDAKRGERLAPHAERLGLRLVGAREDVPQAELSLEAILADDALPTTPPQVVIDPESDFALMFTSGSTGEPKGAQLTHRSVVSAILSWSFQLQVAQRLRPDHPFVPKNPGALLALPLFHVTASHAVFLLSFLTGRKVVFLYKWDAQEAARTIRAERLTNFTCVPTMAQELIEAAAPGDLVTLTDLATGGAKRPESQTARQRERLPSVAASSGYGLTETNALGSVITLADYDLHPASTGRPILPVTQIASFGEGGERLAAGVVGELCVKSPANFRGYMDDEAATRAAFHEGGWFRTGDLGFVDDEGFVTIVDRLKDLIIRGERTSPLSRSRTRSSPRGWRTRPA